jgi:NTE family protein
MATKLRPKVGLALGSGGARGLAHIGVIKILKEHDIPIDIITGSSIGALVGGFYASGLSIKEIENIALSTEGRRALTILSESHLKQRFTGREEVTVFIEKYLGKKTFKDCSVLFAATATDLKTGEAIVINKGKLTTAIRASISIPLAFTPVEFENRVLADGGLTVPVPCKLAREMGAEVVIAVNLDNYYPRQTWKSDPYEILHNSLKIMTHYLAQLCSENADVVINIDVGDTRWFDFTHSQNKIDVGEKAAKEVLPKLKQILKAN